MKKNKKNDVKVLNKNRFYYILLKHQRDVAQLVARLVWDQDVAGSNPVIPIKSFCNNAEVFFCNFYFLLFYISIKN